MDHHNHSHGAPQPSCCEQEKGAPPDFLLWGSLGIVGISYIAHAWFPRSLTNVHLANFTTSAFELIEAMDWGIAMGIIFVGLLGRMPRDAVTALLGRGGTLGGILRATGAGVLLDLCSHGILMVAAKLYERGASTGQVMAFLIASPWNSFSLTFILWALIGLKWTLALIALSVVIAIFSGLLFEHFVKRGVLPKNPYANSIDEPIPTFKEVIAHLRPQTFSLALPLHILWEGLLGSRMVLRWVFFGIILASLIRTFVNPAVFATWFGPSLAGLGLTVVAATILEVCSEGSVPIAADLLTRARAPGNAFAFLMTGVSTDYTEIMILKDTTKSWKISLFLPLITVPQVLLIAWLLNYFSL